MEKQRMGTGRKINSTGLLTMRASGKFCVTLTIFLLIILPAISAQDSGLSVTVETYPGTPSVGVQWILTLFIDHSVPDDVTVIMPQFAPSLFLDRIVKVPRITETQIQTVIEYRFVPNSPGRFLLEPFTVITSEGIVETNPLVLEIRGSGAEQRPSIPRIVWEGVPRQMTAGERTIFTLRAYDWSFGPPPQEFFMPEVPPGVILSPSPLSAEERASGMAIRLNLIPLETGNFLLPARTLQYENAIFEIPALNIRITDRAAGSPSVREQAQSAAQGVAQDAAQSAPQSGVPQDVHAQFPDFNSDAFDKPVLRTWRGQCENIYNTARDLWDNGLRAQALAELRRNERDHPAGALLIPIRQEAEKSLGFFNTENENRRQKLLLGLSIFFLFFVIISLFVCFKFLKGSFARKAVLLCTVVFTALASFCLYRLADSRSVFHGKNSRFGVTNETPVRRTVDFEGEELFSFREGQPVVIMLNSGSWVYVRANDAGGKHGWIPAEAVIFY